MSFFWQDLDPCDIVYMWSCNNTKFYLQKQKQMSRIWKMWISNETHIEALKETQEIYELIIWNTKDAVKALNEDLLINWKQN